MIKPIALVALAAILPASFAQTALPDDAPLTVESDRQSLQLKFNATFLISPSDLQRGRVSVRNGAMISEKDAGQILQSENATVCTVTVNNAEKNVDLAGDRMIADLIYFSTFDKDPVATKDTQVDVRVTAMMLLNASDIYSIDVQRSFHGPPNRVHGPLAITSKQLHECFGKDVAVAKIP